MKKIVSILSFLMLTVHGLKAHILPIDFSAQNKTDTASFPLSVYTSIDLAYYLDKPVNTFLANLDIVAPGYLLSTIYSQDNIRRAARINIYYAGNITYVITVKDFQFLNPFSIDRSWDILLFRKENIHTIDLYNGGILLFGDGD